MRSLTAHDAPQAAHDAVKPFVKTRQVKRLKTGPYTAYESSQHSECKIPAHSWVPRPYYTRKVPVPYSTYNQRIFGIAGGSSWFTHVTAPSSSPTLGGGVRFGVRPHPQGTIHFVFSFLIFCSATMNLVAFWYAIK
jgi:hypothetical protein